MDEIKKLINPGDELFLSYKEDIWQLHVIHDNNIISVESDTLEGAIESALSALKLCD